MANQISASIYRYGNVDATALFSTPGNVVPANMGITETFMTSNVRFVPVRGTVVACGVTMKTIIELLPSGLNKSIYTYYTDATIASLVTASNTALITP